MLVLVLNGITKPFNHRDTETQRRKTDSRPGPLCLCVFVVKSSGISMAAQPLFPSDGAAVFQPPQTGLPIVLGRLENRPSGCGSAALCPPCPRDWALWLRRESRREIFGLGVVSRAPVTPRTKNAQRRRMVLNYDHAVGIAPLEAQDKLTNSVSPETGPDRFRTH